MGMNSRKWARKWECTFRTGEMQLMACAGAVTSNMLRRHDSHQRRKDSTVPGASGCRDCAAMRSECAALGRRVELLERQLRATANLHALLATNDRQLATCRARLEQLERPTTPAATRLHADVQKRVTPAQHTPSMPYRVAVDMDIHGYILSLIHI